MDEGQEKNKEWENFWCTVDEDIFTYIMKGWIEELIDETLKQEFTSEVETTQNEDSDSDEEMTSETEETDDDEPEPDNASVNNYLASANMAMNLESAMKIAEEEDLWIGDSGASSHIIGSISLFFRLPNIQVQEIMLNFSRPRYPAKNQESSSSTQKEAKTP